MGQQTDQAYLLNELYKDASDLDTRIQIQENFNLNPYNWFHWLFDRLDLLTTPGRLLELGCGSGMLWLENLNRLPEGWRITLSDLSIGMLEEARQNLEDSHSAFSFVVADTQLIPFPDEYFDVVIANGVFDHVPDRSLAFAQIQRVLRPSGHLYASAGGRTHLREIEALVKPFVPEANYGGDPEEFGLENGLAQLEPWFAGAALHRYEDALVFREVEPILAYILSESDVESALVEDKRASFVGFLKQQLAWFGEILVTTDKGLFKAYKSI